jgi:tumor protein p53-inducible protein 3
MSSSPPSKSLKLVASTMSAVIATATTSSPNNKPNLIHNNKVILTELPKPSPKSNELLVKISATAINRADTLQRKGLYPPPPGASPALGLEATGEIIERGNSCQSSFKIGDRVMALLPGGGYAEFTSVHEGSCMPVPQGWTDIKAAATPEIFLTAFQLFHILGEATMNDSILIHAAASGVGTSLIQLARLLKCKNIVCTASADKLEYLKTLGATHVYDRKLENWHEEIPKQVGPIQLVLDCVGGPKYSLWNATVLGEDGRWILYGTMGGSSGGDGLLGLILRKRLRIIGTTLRARSVEYKANLISEFMKKGIWDALAKGDISPVIDRTFDGLEQANAALDYLETNVSVGKVVLRVKF